MKFRRRPPEVEALRWDGGNWDAIHELDSRSVDQCVVRAPNVSGKCSVINSGGAVDMNVGDWLILGTDAFLTVLSDGEFWSTYEVGPKEVDPYG